MFSAPESEHEPLRLPSQELIDLWDKAINAPDYLTVEDRQRILGRVQPEADNHCKARCGLILDELLNKAVQQPEELSSDETSIIRWGPKELEPLGPSEALRRLRWPAELQQKEDAAVDVAKTETDKQALIDAKQVHSHLEAQKKAALKQLTNDDARNIHNCNGLKWVQRLDNWPEKSWGFAFFRTSFGDDAAWETFKERFTEAISISFWAVSKADHIRKTWRIQWIEDKSYNEASLDELCQSFRSLCSSSEGQDKLTIEPGLRRDAFLYADSASIESAMQNFPLPKRGFVVAADASHTPEKLSTYHNGFTGSVRVAFTHVFTTFYARLIPRGDPDEKPSAKVGVRQSWDLVYFKARYDKKEEVYPPDRFANRI